MLTFVVAQVLILQAVVMQAVAEPTSVFLQYGPLGVIALLALLAVKVLFDREAKALDLERQRNEALSEELRKLNAAIQDKYLTTLAEATTAIGDALQIARRGRDAH